MERIDFYFIHPYVLSRQGLEKLCAELDAPEILKREVGFLHTSNGNYYIDYVRKVFQLLSNIHEITKFALQASQQDVRLFFFIKEIPSICVQIVRDVGYLFLIPAAFDNAKFLSRFTLEISDKKIVDEFVKLVDLDIQHKNTLLEAIDVNNENIQPRFLGSIEQFDISEENLNRLCIEAISELVVFLKAHGVTHTDIEAMEPELMLRLPGDIEYMKQLYNLLLNSYSSVVNLNLTNRANRASA